MHHRLVAWSIFLLLSGGCALVAPIDAHEASPPGDGERERERERDSIVVVQQPPDDTPYVPPYGGTRIDDAGASQDQAAPATSDAGIDAGPTGGCVHTDADLDCPTYRPMQYVCDRPIATNCVDGGVSSGSYFYCC